MCLQGGKDWRQGCGICSDLYGVNSMAESAARIQHQICSQPEGSTIVVMGHNGPSGLGQMRHNICGVDWKGEEGTFLLLYPALCSMTVLTPFFRFVAYDGQTEPKHHVHLE